MADFERRQLEFGLEFVRWSSNERNNFSEGSPNPKKDVQVIRVRGRQFLNSNYLFHSTCAVVYEQLYSISYTAVRSIFLRIGSASLFLLRECAELLNLGK